MTNLLHGLRVLNTRPEKQAQSLSKEIQALGGQSVELPLLEICASEGWLDYLPDLKKMELAIFVSANAVHHCFTLLQKHHKQWPSSIKVVAIGQASAKALNHFNVTVDAIPAHPDSEHLLALPLLQQAHHIVLFKGQDGRPLIAESLLKKGMNLLALDVYERRLPQICPQFVKSIWHNDLVDIILLTSEQSMHHLFTLFEKEAHPWLQNKACLVLSERLAQTARALGIKTIISSHPERMINTLIDYVIKD